MLELSEKRQKQEEYPVTIKFWDDIFTWLVEYPDLVYKHFTKYFPISELEDISMPGIMDMKRSTIQWPAKFKDLESNTRKTVGGIDRVGPYRLVLGLTSFEDTSFNGLVDLDIQFADLFLQASDSENNFEKASEELKSIRRLIMKGNYSKELIVFLQTRLTIAFLLGWTFRKVSHFELTLLFGKHIWTTFGLPHVPARLVEGLPHMRNPQSSEVVLILNISRDIDRSVLEFVDTWENKPRCLLTTSVEGHEVSSAAHALSIAVELSRKIKSITDKWETEKIHLFGALPAGLATLIGFHLNAIHPIYLYFMDETRSNYKLGGILHNSL